MKIRPDPLLMVNFRCFDCTHKWEAEPNVVEEAPELVWHPYKYFATCPNCGAGGVPQVAWERNLMRAFAHSTGPKTPEGKAAAANNIKGALTPEIRARSRFAMMKHGMNSRVATFFPSKPGKYPHCKSCDYFNRGCNEKDKFMDRPPACMKRAELFLQHHIAFETGDPRLLTGLHADTQAAVRALVDDMILAIVNEGVLIKSPKYHVSPENQKIKLIQYKDEEGKTNTIFDLQANPLLKVLSEYMSRNNMSLSDMEMTPRSKDETESMKGFLDVDRDGSVESSAEYKQRTDESLESLRKLISRATPKPALIEDVVILPEDAEQE